MTLSDSEREWWIAEVLIKRRWHYAEALLWISHRDPGVLADWLMAPKSGENPYRMGAGWIEAVVHLALTEEEGAVIEKAPRAALRSALLSGSVRATGLKTAPSGWSQGSATSDRQLIPPEQWEDYVLVDGGSYHAGSIVAYPTNHVWGRFPASFWSDVLFERDTITSTFPPSRQKPSSRGEWLAERELLEAAEKHVSAPTECPPPVGARWRDEAVDKHGISVRGARRVWDRVAAKHPWLSEPRNKPKTRRPA